MEYTIIEVPDMNDSVSRIVLNGKQYELRFTWNEAGGFWTFGLSDSLGNPIRVGTRIVPQFPLNLFWGSNDMPSGVFGVLTKLDKIGRQDFVNKKAEFVFAPTA